MSPVTRSATRCKHVETASIQEPNESNVSNTTIVKPVMANGSRRSKRQVRVNLSPQVPNRPTPSEHSSKRCKTEVRNDLRTDMRSLTRITTSIASSSFSSSSSQGFLSVEDGTGHKSAESSFQQEQQTWQAERKQLESNIHATDEKLSELTTEYKILHRLVFNDQDHRYAQSEELKQNKTEFQRELDGQASQIHGLEEKIRKQHADHERSYHQSQIEISENLKLWVQQQLNQIKKDIKSEEMRMVSRSMSEKADIVRELLSEPSQHNLNNVSPRDKRHLDPNRLMALLNLPGGLISDGRNDDQKTASEDDIGLLKLTKWSSKTPQAIHGRPRKPSLREYKSRPIDRVRTSQYLSTKRRMSQDVAAGNTSRKATTSPPLYAFVNSNFDSAVQSRSSLDESTRDGSEQHVGQKRRPQPHTSRTPADPILDMSDPLQALAVELCTDSGMLAEVDAGSNFTAEESSDEARDILP